MGIVTLKDRQCFAEALLTLVDRQWHGIYKNILKTGDFSKEKSSVLVFLLLQSQGRDSNFRTCSPVAKPNIGSFIYNIDFVIILQ